MPLTVTSSTGAFLAGLSWEHNAPQLALIKPGGLVITPANAAGNGVSVTLQSNFIQYGVTKPAPGKWQAMIYNATAADYYHFVYLANRAAPPVQLRKPALANESPVTSTYRITWTVPTSTNLVMNLYYTATNAAAFTTTQEVGGVIIQNWPLNAGYYDWDMSFLGSGTYYIYGQVTNGPMPLPTVTDTLTSTAYMPDFLTLYPPGTVVYTDTTPPPVPTNLAVTRLDNAAMACWDASPAHDIAGYLLLYTHPDVSGMDQTHHLRVVATVPYTPTLPAPQQCARLGGLNNGHSVTVTIASYDASGNLSSQSGGVVGTPGPRSPLLPPDTLTGTVDLSYVVSLNWCPTCVIPGSVKGYLLYYAQSAKAGPGHYGSGATEGDSPIDVGLTQTVALHGLAPGFFYHFRVRTYDAAGDLGPLSNDLELLLSVYVDANHDCLPDDWQKAHNAWDANADPDGDGLTNWEEYQLHTAPHLADTDGDGVPDAVEYLLGSNPVDPTSRPAITSTTLLGLLPKLAVAPDGLTFYAYQNGPYVHTQVITLSNTGGKSPAGDTLTPTFASSAGWLTASLGLPVRSGVGANVSVDRTGLAAGHYTGVVTVTAGTSGAVTWPICQPISPALVAGRVMGSPQTVNVYLWVFTGSGTPSDVPVIYLPLIIKN